MLAKRSLGAVTLRYQINGGAVQSEPTSEWDGDETYGPGNDVYYHVVRGSVTGTSPGDSVKVWFTGGGATSDSFTYARRVRQRQAGADRLGGGLHGRVAGLRGSERAQPPVVLHGRPDRERRGLRCL